MLELKFLDSATTYAIEFATVSDKVVSIKGNIPENTSGFLLSRIGQQDAWDYSDYKTVYKVEGDVVQFSNDGSVFEQTTTINVVWNDEDDKEQLRPSSVELTLIRDGKKQPYIINKSDEWSKTIIDTVRPVVYAIEVNDIEGYTSVVNGTSVTYTHEVTPEPQPEVPTVEERLADVESAVLEIYDILGE